MNGIRLSEKHGVNPAIPVCFFCGKDKNEIILAGRLRGDVAAPKKAVWDHVPCDECKKYMDMGIIIKSVDPKSPDHKNPYRTGGWCVLKEEAARNIFGDSLGNSRVAFVDDEAWAKIGLPKEV